MIMQNTNLLQKNSGFTVVELLIATAVFAVVLVVAQTSFIQIGHLFYKGVSITQTQDTADHIFQDINGNFQTATAVSNSSGNGYTYYCIGNTRYTYQIDREVSSSSTSTDPHSSLAAKGTYGVLKDVLPGSGSACSTPCDDTHPPPYTCPTGTVKLSSPVELLGEKMRVEQFNIASSTSTSSLYNVAIVLAYGDQNTLIYSNPVDLSTVSCQADRTNNFCAVSRINTSVYKGWHQ
jgi:prepilin-type N-terminal cleavage/methylation domain-containing protein